MPDKPGVYADVEFYNEWIGGKLRKGKTSFELIHQITFEKNIVDNETYKRNGESNVGILFTNVIVCVFVFVMSKFTSQKIVMVLRRKVFHLKSESCKFFFNFRY